MYLYTRSATQETTITVLSFAGITALDCSAAQISCAISFLLVAQLGQASEPNWAASWQPAVR